ncbi:type III-B CRISPR module-associated Cmr3 family protein [Pelistega sp. MC2]|uniref:type III-B CRISPR module-associated Cmr3 family protein n=1 Tax=Pelistega sp. MC2 TaxID=1720297 RepID=UPI0008D91682|nr:type III-B CRISPR module-associated Cmr3 family protein [Pelistega sp. MC2]
MQHIIFHQIDSWFFKESRSMDGSGASMIMSQFPPPTATLLGALRTAIGSQYHAQHQTTWADFNPQHQLVDYIGYAREYGPLKVQGPWLYHQGELYFKTPLNVLRVMNQNMPSYAFFSLNQSAIKSDLGEIVYPALNYQNGQSALSESYISASDYTQVLNGQPPQKVYYPEEIWCSDGRLGIAVEHAVRKVIDGKLYQTNHIRLLGDWDVYLGLHSDQTDYPLKDTLVRLGGEARMGAVEILSNVPTLPIQQTQGFTKQLVMYLLTALPDWRGIEHKHLPPLPNSSFKAIKKEGRTVWAGILEGIDVEIFSAVLGKPERIGGWDMLGHQSVPVRSFTPAGSCWYINTENIEKAQQLVEKLHLKYLTQGNERALGYGQVAFGKLVGF